VVVHLSPVGPGLLPGILARAGPLPVTGAADDQCFELGYIYVAPSHGRIPELLANFPMAHICRVGSCQSSGDLFEVPSRQQTRQTRNLNAAYLVRTLSRRRSSLAALRTMRLTTKLNARNDSTAAGRQTEHGFAQPIALISNPRCRRLATSRPEEMSSAAPR
jgi:hypothetical protein